MTTADSTPCFAGEVDNSLGFTIAIKILKSCNILERVAIYYSGNYGADFHDITSGNNGGCGSECNAGPGYDLVTGLGTYQANNLYIDLVAAPN